MRLRSFAAAAAGLALLATGAGSPADADLARSGAEPGRAVAPATAPLDADLDDALADDLSATRIVAVWAADAAEARAVAEGAGLTVTAAFEKVDTVIATGDGHAIAALRSAHPEVHVELQTPMSASLDTAHDATGVEAVYRNVEDLAVYDGPNGERLDGRGVTIAIVDTGIDVNHPMFNESVVGESKVLANYVSTPLGVLTSVPSSDEAGGHGTHVAGIAAGYDVTTIDGISLRGVAPGAKLMVFDAGAGINMVGHPAALNFVLDHHDAPCLAGGVWFSDPVTCPPIRVVNNSYGSSGRYDPNDLVSRLSDNLAREDVVMVWAAGNSGGDGTELRTNPTSQSPVPGVLAVANYNEAQRGDRNNALSGSSSRGLAGDQPTYPDLSAPGSSILSACRPDLPVCKGFATLDLNYGSISGTSMASPYVAGAVAVLLQAHPDLTAAEVEALVSASAHKFTRGAAYEADLAHEDHGTLSFDKGHGLLDIAVALRLAAAS